MSNDQRSQDLMTEARECFLEADFEQAMTKFTEVKELATKDERWSDVLASETGMAEVNIQQKEWDAASKSLSAAIDAAKGKTVEARDATRAHYMLGIALLGLKKLPEAKVQFEAAQSRLAEGVEDSDGMLSDIQDRLAQTNSADSVDEDDLMEIAMEFGVAPEEEEEEDEGDVGEEDLDEEDEEGGEDYEEEEEAEQAARYTRKRRAANGAGDNNEDEEDDDDEEEDDYEDEEEDEEGSAPEKRARRGQESQNGCVQPDSSNSKGRRQKADENSRKSADSGDEVSSSA